MSTRQNALNEWLTETQKLSLYDLTLLAGDASFRRYFRLTTSDAHYVVMDAPPEKEGLSAFIQINHHLASHGIHTPSIIAVDPTQGFMLLEDLGDTLLLDHLSAKNADARYTAALNTLLTLQTCSTTTPKLPVFNAAFMQQEMHLFQTWFLESLLGINLNAHEQQQLQLVYNKLIHHLQEQPQCFIHRDYHSRNIMIVNEKKNADHLTSLSDNAASIIDIGVIDFQDAMQGPFTYDLVSLLKDCYVHWPDETRMTWMNYFYQNLPDKHGWSHSAFQHGFDWCGLQRHFKILGIFSRLHLRDKKSAYLKDLPLTLHYTLSCLARYDDFHALHDIMQQRVLPIFEEMQPV